MEMEEEEKEGCPTLPKAALGTGEEGEVGKATGAVAVAVAVAVVAEACMSTMEVCTEASEEDTVAFLEKCPWMPSPGSPRTPPTVVLLGCSEEGGAVLPPLGGFLRAARAAGSALG